MYYVFFVMLHDVLVKILHLGKFYPPFMGGIENFMFDLMKAQKNKGNQITAVVHHHEFGKPTSIEATDIGCVYRVKTYGQLAYAPIAPSFGKVLSQAVVEFQPDLIHIHMPNVSAFWYLLLPRVKNIPCVIHWHSDVLGSVPDFKIRCLYPLYAIFEKALLQKSKAIIATSPPYLKTSRPLLEFLYKTKMIPLGIADSDLQPSYKANSDKRNAELKLLMIGRLTYYKGHELLLKAIADLNISNIRLDIVGSGELADGINGLITKLNLQKTVRLCGKLSDAELSKAINDCDLVCLPSIERTEAFGVVLLEAARASKASLVTDVLGSGMSWVVKDNFTGFVTKANSQAHLQAKLRKVIESPELLVLYGKNARERYELSFKIDKIEESMKVLYNAVLKS